MVFNVLILFNREIDEAIDRHLDTNIHDNTDDVEEAQVARLSITDDPVEVRRMRTITNYGASTSSGQPSYPSYPSDDDDISNENNR